MMDTRIAITKECVAEQDAAAAAHYLASVSMADHSALRTIQWQETAAQHAARAMMLLQVLQDLF
jgi:hypothetical protein